MGEICLNKFSDLIYKYRFAILLIMVIASFLNALRFVGKWGEFWGVVAVQVFYGQAVFCYISRRTIRIGPGGITTDCPWAGRMAAGGFSLLVYLLMFAFNGYGRDWW